MTWRSELNVIKTTFVRATESINLALKGILEPYSGQSRHIITCTTEHKAVLDTCVHLQKNGCDVTFIKVNTDGIINTADIEQAIRPDTVLIAVMLSNNETGVLQPTDEIAAIAKKNKLLFFCDATQSIGKIKMNISEAGFDFMAFSAHKFYGPKGIGALYINKKSDRPLVAQIDGGGHEGGMRSGTLNVPSIVGFGKAAELRMSEMSSDETTIRTLRNQLESAVLTINGTRLNGHHSHRLYNVSNISFDGVEPRRLMMSLSKWIAVSSGSACSSIVQEPSHVLKAMGFDQERAMNAIRFSLGKFNTAQEINFAVEKVKDTIAELRR